MAKNRKKTEAPLPPDQDCRYRILRELDRNMLVEAGAGTGKTFCMAKRMIELLKRGQCKSIANLAAVTFTRKAAAELRSRFQLLLEQEVREAEGIEKRNLEKALEHIEQGFIGTIHSFCARLLRERPVEAGVDPNFEEADEAMDRILRKEAWDGFTARARFDELEDAGLRLVDLEPAFLRFADYPDVEEWPARDSPGVERDYDSTSSEVLRYVKHMRSLHTSLPKDAGNDELIPLYQSLPRVVSHYDDLTHPPDLMDVLARFKKAKVVQKIWGDMKEEKERAKEEQKRWNGFREEWALPALRGWYEKLYGPVVGVLVQGREVYDELRRYRGVLNYQDLLMRAAALLRDHPHVRRYFQKRFTHLLVDEFQDTDPVQAEVLLYLTAEDLEEKTWWRCKPKPGSLFVVGDPKQSIYRFRRADIVTYNMVKEIIAGGGSIVPLTANFRTVPSVIDWINRVFDPDFPTEPTRYSPAYARLEPGRAEKGKAELEGVWVLSVPEEFSRKEQVIEYEADRIARFIHNALDDHPSRIDASDFMILARNKTHLSVYARKLRELEVPHQVSGGSSLNEVRELKLLHLCLEAVAQPENPVALVAVLRSELFGVSDAALYEFKTKGGRFDFRTDAPPSCEALTDAFQRLKRYARRLENLPPFLAVESMALDLGLAVSASLVPGGDIQAGSLFKAVEILRGLQGEMWTSGQLMEYLDRLVKAEEKYDGLSALSREPPRVRIMNLHKAKGLEAPIVFLADPYGEASHEVELCIDRGRDRIRGYMAIFREGPGKSRNKLALPRDWEGLIAEEKKFQEAEVLRLRYVAATRAGSMLIITQCGAKGGKNRYNPWKHFAKDLSDCPELPDFDLSAKEGTPGKSVDLRPEEIIAAREEIGHRKESAHESTYEIHGARDYAAIRRSKRRAVVSSYTAGSEEGGEHGTEWGTLIHRLLELAMKEWERSRLINTARTFLLEHDMDPERALEAVEIVESAMKSSIWERSLKSKRRFIEVPYQRRTDDERPTIVRGVIDLVFEEEDGWVIVDYKTDRVDRAGAERLAKAYESQLLEYEEAWKHFVVEPVKEKWLYFVRPEDKKPFLIGI